MNDALMASAYLTARENFKAAQLATFTRLDASFKSEALDTIHQASHSDDASHCHDGPGIEDLGGDDTIREG